MLPIRSRLSAPRPSSIPAKKPPAASAASPRGMPVRRCTSVEPQNALLNSTLMTSTSISQPSQ